MKCLCSSVARGLSAPIWQRFLASVKDRSVREIGIEAITAGASVLAAPLRMATATVDKIIDVLRRLWMEFVAGKVKTLANVVSACLKAVFAAASIGVAVAVESELALQIGSVPFGDILAALCAAVVAGVMIVLGNRGIDYVVRSLFGLFQGAEVARCRREEIEAFCAEAVPRLVEDREHLKALVESHIAGHEAVLDRTFPDLRLARDTDDIDGFIKALNEHASSSMAHVRPVRWLHASPGTPETLRASDKSHVCSRFIIPSPDFAPAIHPRARLAHPVPFTCRAFRRGT